MLSHSKMHFNIIFPSTFRFSKWFYLRFPHRKPVRISSAPIRATYPAHLIHLGLINRIIFVEEYKSLSSSLCSHLHSLLTRPLLGPNILLITLFLNSPHHPILEHLQTTFLRQCERPSFTPIQNNTQNYTSVYLNFYIFG